MSRPNSSFASSRRLFGRSISHRVLGSLIAIYFATYVTTALIVYSSVHTSIVESNVNALHQLAQRRYEHLETTFQSLALNLTAWSQLDVMNDLVSGDIDKRISQALDNAKRLYGLDGNIYVFDAAGKLIATTRAGATPTELPAIWQRHPDHLIFLDKHAGPMSGQDVVALEVPIYASFDRHQQTGLMVLTCPWTTVKGLLASNDAAIVLVTNEGSSRILSADWTSVPKSVSKDEVTSLRDGAEKGVVVGTSMPGDGLIGAWRVIAMQKSAVVTHLLARVGEELILLGALLAVPIVVLGRWLSKRLAEPIVDLTRVVTDIAHTNRFDLRVDVSTTDEFRELARAFNAMTEKLGHAAEDREQFVLELERLNETLEAKVVERTKALEIAVQSQQRLMRDISHEIKSPLARLGMAVGLLRRSRDMASAERHVARIELEIENISSLASELLTLMTLDNLEHPATSLPVNIGLLVRDVVQDAVYENPERGDDVSIDVPVGEMLVAGDGKLLKRAVENVVRNALFYTGRNTRVHVSLERLNEKHVRLSVADRGTGVPDSALDHLFDPFYRVDEARTRKTGGSGIGLAICRRVVLLHGGAVRALRNQPSGLVVEMVLPVMAAEQ